MVPCQLEGHQRSLRHNSETWEVFLVLDSG
jgi:hypothetical protein